MKYKMEKTYGNDRGFSCCFRQWRATHSHCSLLHGYSLGFKFVIGADKLDSRNWVFDFGNFKDIKEMLTAYFDHTFVIAKDDPNKSEFLELGNIRKPDTMTNFTSIDSKEVLYRRGAVCDLIIMDNVGCESFAEFVFKQADAIITNLNLENNPKLLSVTVFEHGANSATYNGE